MIKHLWEHIHDSPWRQKIVLASAPLWKYKDEMPIAVASACLVDYMGCRFLLSIAHASIATTTWRLEINGVEKIENGELRTVLQPVEMGFLSQFTLEDEEITEPKIVDFTYLKIPSHVTSRQVLGILKDGNLFGFDRSILQPDFDKRPCPDKKYGFYGKTRFGGVNGKYMIFEDRLEDDLTYVREEGEYYVFKLSHKYGSHDNYRGCSGAPIIDEDGNLYGLVSHGIKSENLIYAINISKYRSALELETKPT